jgi:hypothetical protein
MTVLKKFNFLSYKNHSSKYHGFCLKTFCIFLLAAALGVNSTSQAYRIGTRDQNWTTVSTEHFEIIFPEAQKSLALHYAKTAEQNLADLKMIFKEIPQKITVIINDSTDFSNGYSTVIPFPHIMIYPVQVGEESPLSESGEWANELFVHELTHILQLYPARGFYRLLKPIFGSIVAPNLLMPTWWKEGMAVEVETQYSSQGRLRSSYQSAVTRSFFLDNKLGLFTLAQANESLMKWPYGNLPYYWGSYLFSDLVQDRETKGLNLLVERQSERIPYFIDAPILELSGGSFDALFRKTQQNLLQTAQDQVGAIKSTEVTENTPVAPDLRSSRHPRFSPDGSKIALIGTDNLETRIRVYEKSSAPASEKPTWQEIKFKKTISGDLESFVFHPTQNKIYFSKAERRNLRDTFTEIYEADLTSGEQKQLTTNRRGRQLTISPDGSKLAFISTANGETNLALLHLSSDRVEYIHSEKFQNRINGVTFVSENEVLFTVRNPAGEQFQYIINLATNKTSELQIDSHLRFPFYKNNTLYFVSNKTGVLNIYKSQPLKTKYSQPVPVTNLLTGAQSFDVNANKKTLVYTQISSNGLQVVESEWPLVTPLLKTINPYPKDRYPESQRSITNDNSTDASVVVTEEKYAPGSFLIPKFWIPFFGTSSANNGFYFQAMTTGFDPLQTHNYQAQLSYDTDLARGGYFFQYTNSVWPWSWQLAADQTQQLFGGANLIVEKRNSSLAIIPDVFSLNKNLTLAFGPNYSAHNINVSSSTPGAVPTTEHVGGFALAAYSTIDQKPFEYYPMSGWTGSFKVERNSALQDWGSFHQSYTRLTSAGSLYYSKGLPSQHAGYFKANLLYIPETIASRYGTSNSVFPTASDSSRAEFMLRGYKSGQFYGTQMASVTAEYRLPIIDIFRGSGSDPFFVKHVTGALITDGLTLKGSGLTENDVTNVLNFGDSFWSAGAELRLATTIGYMLPVNFVLGGYVPLSPTYSKSAAIAMSLQIGALN